jgi:hypothetical protein
MVKMWEKVCKKYWNPNFCGPEKEKCSEVQAENILKLWRSLFRMKKKIGADRLRYFILNFCRRVQFYYFSIQMLLFFTFLLVFTKFFAYRNFDEIFGVKTLWAL